MWEGMDEAGGRRLGGDGTFALPWSPANPVPREMTRGMGVCVHVRATEMAVQGLRHAGAAPRARLPAFRFITPVSNQRTDEYGGSLAQVFAESARMSARISAADRHSGNCRRTAGGEITCDPVPDAVQRPPKNHRRNHGSR